MSSGHEDPELADDQMQETLYKVAAKMANPMQQQDLWSLRCYMLLYAVITFNSKAFGHYAVIIIQ